jgi:UDP-glucose 4-epimerase
MRVLITGGAGFIGSNLCRRLAAEHPEWRVTILDDLSTGDAANLTGVDADLVKGTILDADLVRTLVGASDAVVHLAARPSVARSLDDPVASHSVNATGTLTVLEAARAGLPLGRAPHVIVASSSSVYGANPALPKHESLAQLPMSPYAASKVATEAYALAYQHSYGLAVLALRLFNVFGPWQGADHAYAAVVPAFVSAALGRRPIPVHGDGRQTRDFTSVDTVTAVLADALARRVVDPEPVNLAFGTRTDLLEVIAILEGLLGRRLEVEYHPPRAGDVRDSQADGARLAQRFPEVEPVPFVDALAATVTWFEEQAGRA